MQTNNCMYIISETKKKKKKKQQKKTYWTWESQTETCRTGQVCQYQHKIQNQSSPPPPPQKKKIWKLQEKVKAKYDSEIVKEEATNLVSKTKEGPSVLTNEGQNTRQLEDERKENRSGKKIEYTVFQQTSQKETQTRSQKKWNNHVENMPQRGGGPKQIYKGRPKKKTWSEKWSKWSTDTNETLKCLPLFT